MPKKILDIVLLLFLGCSSYLVVFYAIRLYKVYQSPAFRGFATEGYLWIAAIVVVIVMDFFIARRLFLKK
jgi:hypothetical protein